MRKNYQEKLSKPLLFTAYALLFITLGLCIFLLIRKDLEYPVELIIVNLLSIGVCFTYFSNGYTKNVAKYFRLAMLFEASTYILDVLALAMRPIQIVVDSGTLVSAAIILIMYGNTLIIAVGKDLGKRASFIIYGSNTCLYVVTLLVSIKTGLASEISAIIWLALSIVGLIMIEAKYIDKENRNAII